MNDKQSKNISQKNLAKEVMNELLLRADKKRADASMKFFKTDAGQYGFGDEFIGVRVPDQRKVAKMFRNLSLAETEKLLTSTIHEHRLTALFILIYQYEHGDEQMKEWIYVLYMKNIHHINNWDLVDSSAGYIVGQFLKDKDRSVLYDLVSSDELWKKRIAIIATFAYIRDGEFTDTLKISEILLHDSHDLIHKAVGWMLREVGKKDESVLNSFLDKHFKIMPRTMLRYAIEKLPKATRASYMAK